MPSSDEKDKRTILANFYSDWNPGQSEHEHKKWSMVVCCVEDVENALKGLNKSLASSAVLIANSLNSVGDSINESSEASDKLSFRLLVLNYILAGAAVIGASIAVIKFLR